MRKALSPAEVLRVSFVGQQKHVQELSRNTEFGPVRKYNVRHCGVWSSRACFQKASAGAHTHLGLWPLPKVKDLWIINWL